MTITDKGRGEDRKTGSGKKTAALPKVVQSEALHSLNHLYQSAVYSAIRSSVKNIAYGESIQKVVQLQSLARKSTLRLDLSIKRSFCRRCNVPLLPGLTSSVHSRTFAPSSRAIQIKCLLCSFSRRTVAPPYKLENSNKRARRHRIKQAKRLQQITLAKVIKAHLANPVSTSSNSNSTTAIYKEMLPERKGKLSQKARRRAGKVKAQMMNDISINNVSRPVILDDRLVEKKADRRRPISNLPRYTQRSKGESVWADAIWASEMSSHEKEAIVTLRGDHLSSSGIGRGGQVGKLQAPLQSS